MTKGGLYIPLPEHTEIYCSTTHYIQCHQYIRGKEIFSEAAAAEGNGDSRRRHRRIKEQVPVSIVACDSLGKLIGDKEEETSTIDLSLGGLRLTSRSERQTNELLLLKLIQDKSESPITGIGEVRWCNAMNKSADYRVGIAFKTKETSWAVGKYLDLGVT